MHPAGVEALAELFHGLPLVMFCVKDVDGRYLAVNQAFADRVARTRPADVVGHRASDLFPRELAVSYEQQDAAVVATGRPIRGKPELILRPDGSRGWYATTKVPITENGTVVAIAAVSVDLQASPETRLDVAGLAAVVDFVAGHYHEPLQVADIAEAAGMTPAQLERRLRRVLGVSPKQLLLRTRVDEAARLLAETDESLADIAARCGFYDQSSFTRRFKWAVGLTPGAYRAQQRPAGGADRA